MTMKSCNEKSKLANATHTQKKIGKNREN